MFDEEKFWSLVNKTSDNECWIWNGQVSSRGYGFVFYDHTKHYVLRLSYQYANGTVDDQNIIAACSENRLCVNPSHLSVIPKTRPLSERFWEKVAIGNESECWEWQAAKNLKGYGVISDKPNGLNRIAAHRVAYALHYDVTPNDKFVCHSCDNPACVNPHHLWLGDCGENNRDARDKGRRYQPNVKGINNGRAVLTPENVGFIRQHYNHDLTASQMAQMFGVSVSTIRSAAKGKSWL